MCFTRDVCGSHSHIWLDYMHIARAFAIRDLCVSMCARQVVGPSEYTVFCTRHDDGPSVRGEEERVSRCPHLGDKTKALTGLDLAKRILL